MIQAANLEAKQEVGVDEIQNVSLFSKTVAGSTIEWDLYYLTGKVGTIGQQELEDEEKQHGIEVGFYSKEKVLKMLQNGDISEDRTVGILFKYILNSSR